MGSATDENYKTIKFKAKSVKTFNEYLYDYKIKKGRKELLISDAANMLCSLVQQLNYLLENASSTIIGYTPEEIIVINEEKFVFLGSDLVCNFDSESEKAIISYPFSSNDFFFSPEAIKVKEIPGYVHYKTCYFSLACLVIYAMLGDNNFYIEYLREKKPQKIVEFLNNHPIKKTKLYWLLLRCLTEDANNRSIILI